MYNITYSTYPYSISDSFYIDGAAAVGRVRTDEFKFSTPRLPLLYIIIHCWNSEYATKRKLKKKKKIVIKQNTSNGSGGGRSCAATIEPPTHNNRILYILCKSLDTYLLAFTYNNTVYTYTYAYIGLHENAMN